MTNKEIFMMVFGKNPENLKRKASTIEWWDQEFIGFIGLPDCADAISRQAVDELSKEVAQALKEFADNLEQIEKKYADPKESEDKCKNCKYSRNPDYTRCHDCKVESEEISREEIAALLARGSEE